MDNKPHPDRVGLYSNDPPTKEPEKSPSGEPTESPGLGSPKKKSKRGPRKTQKTLQSQEDKKRKLEEDRQAAIDRGEDPDAEEEEEQPARKKTERGRSAPKEVNDAKQLEQGAKEGFPGERRKIPQNPPKGFKNYRSAERRARQRERAEAARQDRLFDATGNDPASLGLTEAGWQELLAEDQALREEYAAAAAAADIQSSNAPDMLHSRLNTTSDVSVPKTYRNSTTQVDRPPSYRDAEVQAPAIIPPPPPRVAAPPPTPAAPTPIAVAPPQTPVAPRSPVARPSSPVSRWLKDKPVLTGDGPDPDCARLAQRNPWFRLCFTLTITENYWRPFLDDSDEALWPDKGNFDRHWSADLVKAGGHLKAIVPFCAYISGHDLHPFHQRTTPGTEHHAVMSWYYANRACRHFLLQEIDKDAWDWMIMVTKKDRPRLEGSHLCHEDECGSTRHIQIEPQKLNLNRKPCGGKNKPTRERACTVAGHDPPCFGKNEVPHSFAEDVDHFKGKEKLKSMFVCPFERCDRRRSFRGAADFMMHLNDDHDEAIACCGQYFKHEDYMAHVEAEHGGEGQIDLTCVVKSCAWLVALKESHWLAKIVVEAICECDRILPDNETRLCDSERFADFFDAPEPRTRQRHTRSAQPHTPSPKSPTMMQRWLSKPAETPVLDLANRPNLPPPGNNAAIQRYTEEDEEAEE